MSRSTGSRPASTISRRIASTVRISGVVAPASGEGIYYAMACARMGAEAAALSNRILVNVERYRVALALRAGAR